MLFYFVLLENLNTQKCKQIGIMNPHAPTTQLHCSTLGNLVSSLPTPISSFPYFEAYIRYYIVLSICQYVPLRDKFNFKNIQSTITML